MSFSPGKLLPGRRTAPNQVWNQIKAFFPGKITFQGNKQNPVKFAIKNAIFRGRNTLQNIQNPIPNTDQPSKMLFCPGNKHERAKFATKMNPPKNAPLPPGKTTSQETKQNPSNLQSDKATTTQPNPITTPSRNKEEEKINRQFQKVP